ncbi:MAG: inositol monophosphatase family protein [Candidatus ainarchaeum sp.]|nr:inositol monophosphatase family protein [Candidatus ainarchaeum sp.]
MQKEGFEYYKFIDNLVKNAGKIIKKGYYGKFEIKEKNKQDYVTGIDLETEKFIKREIGKKFPEHNILAEESGEGNNNSEYLWIIGPLDGTTNFIHKIPIFAISIALEYKKEIITGVIYNPITDELFYAEKGKGAYLNGKGLKIKNNKKIENWFLAWCYPDSKRNEKPVKKIWELFYPECLRVTKLGSAAIELAYVADNRVDGYLSIGLKKWDYSAGELIVQEAGGVLLKEQFLGEKLFIASSKENAQKIKELIFE